MTPIIVYPIPFDRWDHYFEQVFRFASSFKQFPPGADYELRIVCIWGEPVDLIRSAFYGTKAVYVPYNYDGCDIGAAQYMAALNDGFILGMPTHSYFHRAGWLKRLLEVRMEFGPGLYGASGSFEEGLHLRTAGYGIDSEHFCKYPKLVNNREACSAFERGPDSLTNFALKSGWPVKQVTWDGVQSLEDCRKPPGVFRNGEQNAMLWHDRHCLIYEQADPTEKLRLENLANGVNP